MSNRVILDEILKYAKSLGKEDSPMTEEKYMVAVIDVVSGEAELKGGYPSSGVQKQLEALNVDLPSLRRELLAYINKPNPLAFLDDFYMQKAMTAAQKRAKGTKTGELTPELVLECVLAAPSENLERSLSAHKKAETPSAKPTSSSDGEPSVDENPLAAMQFDLNEILEELGLSTPKGGKETETAEETPKAEPSPRDRIAELTARTRTALGGRAAELVYYGAEDGVSTGASGDLQSATSTAMSMICSYGMDDAFGLAAFDPRTVMAGESFGTLKAAVNDLLRREMAVAVERIGKNRVAIDALVKVLLTKNHLAGAEVDAIFREHAVK